MNRVTYDGSSPRWVNWMRARRGQLLCRLGVRSPSGCGILHRCYGHSRRTKQLVGGLLVVAALLTSCTTDADVVSRNLSTDADNFKISRRIVFFNGITDTYLLTIEGKCSILDANRQLEVTCKTGDDGYKKHFLGLSDNVSYYAEQLNGADVSPYHYKVVFKPSVIVPEIEVR